MTSGMRGRDEDGFVLIELMIALAILSVMAALVMLGMNQISQSATEARDSANDDTCSTAIAAYRADNDGAAPTVDADLAMYIDDGSAPGCLP